MFIIAQNGDAIQSDTVKRFAVERKFNDYEKYRSSLVADCGYYRSYILGEYDTVDEAAEEMKAVLRHIISHAEIYIVSGAEEG